MVGSEPLFVQRFTTILQTSGKYVTKWRYLTFMYPVINMKEGLRDKSLSKSIFDRYK